MKLNQRLKRLEQLAKQLGSSIHCHFCRDGQSGDGPTTVALDGSIVPLMADQTLLYGHDNRCRHCGQACISKEPRVHVEVPAVLVALVTASSGHHGQIDPPEPKQRVLDLLFERSIDHVL